MAENLRSLGVVECDLFLIGIHSLTASAIAIVTTI